MGVPRIAEEEKKLADRKRAGASVGASVCVDRILACFRYQVEDLWPVWLYHIVVHSTFV